MTSLQQLLHSLEEHSKASYRRSDVLRVLIWPGGIIATMLVAAMYARAPIWLISALFIALMIILALYLGAFTYLLFTDRDALRSERYQIEKMAIEKGIYGDNLIGVREGDSRTPREIGSASLDAGQPK